MAEIKKGFYFLRSFWKSAQIIKDPIKRVEFYDKVCLYEFENVEPNFTDDILQMAWVNIEPYLHKQSLGGAPQGNHNNPPQLKSIKVNQSQLKSIQKSIEVNPSQSPQREQSTESLVCLINNNNINAREKEDVDNLRKPFLAYYKDFFTTSGTVAEYEQLALEVIDTMIVAKQKANESVLKFNNKNYNSQDFANLLLKIDSDKLSKIVSTLKFTETEIKDRYLYILSCIINQANEKQKAVAV